jgi:GrpB-like predicted nucleotidyltransferase (UPF0157 family)
MLLKKYTSTWIKDFEMIRGEIENGLLGMDFTIEHVGSTSVPELDAKPIIDIDLVFFNHQDFEVIKYVLEKLGYYHNGNQGIENREVFKRYGQSTNNILDSIAHHLYVCPKDSKALERHILSRNYLRKNEWARIKYQEMKYEIALKANQDRKKYAELKEQNINGFIDSIVEKEKSSI